MNQINYWTLDKVLTTGGRNAIPLRFNSLGESAQEVINVLEAADIIELTKCGIYWESTTLLNKEALNPIRGYYLTEYGMESNVDAIQELLENNGFEIYYPTLEEAGL